MSQPRYGYPRLIQQMTSRSKNNQVRLSERYHFEYMGASEFEGTVLSQTVRSMNGNCELGTFNIDGIQIYACWDNRVYDAVGVELVLQQIYFQQIRLVEPVKFNARTYQQYKALEKQRQKLRAEYIPNAWIDIQNGLFWTWEKINIKDIPLNIAKSVAWMDLTPEQRRAAQQSAHVKPTLGAQMGDLRERLAANKSSH